MPQPEDSPSRLRGSLPARIGRYRIIDRVGRGAMGVVYAAHDDNMGRPVAIKVLMADLESDPETRARFYREAQAAAGLLHPNIITIFDAAEDQGRSYIVMQLLEGWPLAAYLKQPEAAPLERKLDLMVQFCEGLAAAHGRGIVHRDLKPGNLFVQSDGLLKILDFGVARLADSSMTATGMVLGTPDYMSPEQARGTQVDNRSDIFSVGAVFYFMLTGHKPFPGPDLPAVLRQLQFEAPAPMSESESPPELARLVMQAMAKDPADRPSRVQDLLAGIVKFRRHYQAETRKLAAVAGARYDALIAVKADRAEAGAALDLAEIDSASPVMEDLLGRFPALAQRGGAALESAAFDRARVTELLSELETEERRLRAEVSSWRTHVATLDAGARALATGDAHTALQLLEQVSAECPASARARELASRSRAAAREQQARERRLAEMAGEARVAFEARDWRAAVRRCEDALALAPGHAPSLTLLSEAQHALAREERRKALLLQGHLDRAGAAIEEQRFADADGSLQEAAAIDPLSSDVAELRRELEEARAAAADAERLARVTADEVRRARAGFRRGHDDEALRRLRDFVASEPHALDAAAELDRLAGLQQRMQQSLQAQRQRVLDAMARATRFAERGAFDEAVATARDAARADASDHEAVTLLDQLIERALDARLARERARAGDERASAAEHMVAAAREAYARGYVAIALRAAENAVRLAPARADAGALVEELRRVAAADDEDAFDLGEWVAGGRVREPTAAAPGDVRPPEPPDGERHPERGVFAQMNQWAAELFRRWPSTR